MTKIIKILLLSGSMFLSINASCVDQWLYSDNETLYKNMLGYLGTASQALVGEPFYYMVQDFKIEVEAAHQNDKYAWIGQTFDFCSKLEAIYPPAISHNSVLAEDRYEKVRRIIMYIKDYPIHEHTIQSEEDNNIVPPADQVTAFHAANKQFLTLKKNAVLEFLRSPRPTSNSIQIAKLYSSGFIFRTAATCIGLDINIEEGMYTGDGREEITSALDAVFITHAHGDHYDIPMMTKMLEAGKPVVMTTDMVPNAPSGKKFVWKEDVPSQVDITAGVKAMAAMGAQGTTPCLLYYIDVDGWKIVALGDNSMTDKEEFFHGKQVPDIAVIPIFQGLSTLNKHLHEGSNEEGVTPLYLTAHENEWHHATNGRISYRYLYYYAYASCKSDAMHTVMMDNGETITLSK